MCIWLFLTWLLKIQQNASYFFCPIPITTQIILCTVGCLLDDYNKNSHLEKKVGYTKQWLVHDMCHSPTGKKCKDLLLWYKETFLASPSTWLLPVVLWGTVCLSSLTLPGTPEGVCWGRNSFLSLLFSAIGLGAKSCFRVQNYKISAD